MVFCQVKIHKSNWKEKSGSLMEGLWLRQTLKEFYAVVAAETVHGSKTPRERVGMRGTEE